MVRISAIFISTCMVLIAGSLGFVVYLRFGFTGAESALVALGTLTALAVYNAISARKNDRLEASNQLANLARGSDDLARQLAEFGRRLSAVEVKVETVVDRALATAQPLAAEIEEMSALVKQLADSVAMHETAISNTVLAVERRGYQAPQAQAASAAPVAAAPPVAPASLPSAVAAAPVAQAASAPPPIDRNIPAFAGFDRDGIIAAIRRAIDSGRIEAGRLMPSLDNLSVVRCVQVVRRLLLKSRDVGLFCNLSSATLTDSSFPKFLEFMEANRAIAPALVFEFTQSAVRAMGPIEHESLAALAERGYRFSIDNLTDLRVEARELNERGFRFVKAPAALLFNRVGLVSTDIHPADFSDLLGRFGIDLIADHIESESTVVDLLDFDVRFGQGMLFSPPRPVRAEALQAVSEAPRETPFAPAANDAPPPAPAAAPAGNLAQLARAFSRRV
jgi:cyclic-di-GMP phosphodiesterase TipF (flagellum assembly factor)